MKEINKKVVNKSSKMRTDVKGVECDKEWEAGNKVRIWNRVLGLRKLANVWGDDDYKRVEHRINLKLA